MSASEDLSIAFIIGGPIIAIVIGMVCLLCSKEQTNREAIKAGLIQNDMGYWVKPPVPFKAEKP